MATRIKKDLDKLRGKKLKRSAQRAVRLSLQIEKNPVRTIKREGASGILKQRVSTGTALRRRAGKKQKFAAKAVKKRFGKGRRLKRPSGKKR